MFPHAHTCSTYTHVFYMHAHVFHMQVPTWVLNEMKLVGPHSSDPANPRKLQSLPSISMDITLLPDTSQPRPPTGSVAPPSPRSFATTPDIPKMLSPHPGGLNGGLKSPVASPPGVLSPLSPTLSSFNFGQTPPPSAASTSRKQINIEPIRLPAVAVGGHMRPASSISSLGPIPIPPTRGGSQFNPLNMKKSRSNVDIAPRTGPWPKPLPKQQSMIQIKSQLVNVSRSSSQQSVTQDPLFRESGTDTSTNSSRTDCSYSQESLSSKRGTEVCDNWVTLDTLKRGQPLNKGQVIIIISTSHRDSTFVTSEKRTTSEQRTSYFPLPIVKVHLLPLKRGQPHEEDTNLSLPLYDPPLSSSQASGLPRLAVRGHQKTAHPVHRRSRASSDAESAVLEEKKAHREEQLEGEISILKGEMAKVTMESTVSVSWV